MPNLNETNYTEEEVNGNFELRKFKLDEIEDILKESLSWGERNKNIGLTMLEALNVYKNRNS